MAKTLAALFKTDKNAEVDGVWFRYGDTRVRLARAGGSNQRYHKIVEQNVKPHKRAIQTKTISNEAAEEIAFKSFAEGCVMGWQYAVYGEDGNEETIEWKDGIADEDDAGNLVVLDITIPNIVATFKKYRDFYSELTNDAQNIAVYRAEVGELTAKN